MMRSLPGELSMLTAIDPLSPAGVVTSGRMTGLGVEIVSGPVDRPWHRPSYFPRPADERRVIRRKSFAMTPCTVDEAALQIELLDYNFHLFTEKGSATAAVLYRGGPTLQPSAGGTHPGGSAEPV